MDVVNTTTLIYDPPYYDVKIETPGTAPTSGYDHNSNIVRMEDQRWTGTYGFSQAYTVDRLVDASVQGGLQPPRGFHAR